VPLTITHAKSNTIGDFTGTVTVFNSAGTTVTASATDLVRPVDWNSGHQFTVSLSASEFAAAFVLQNGLSSSTDASSFSFGVDTGAYWEPFPLHNTNSTLSSPGIGTWYIDGPYKVPLGFGKGQIRMLVSNAAGFANGGVYSAASTGSVTRVQTFYHNLAIYQRGTGASTSRLESVSTFLLSILASQNILLGTANTSSGTITNRVTISFPAQWDSTGGVAYSSTAQSGTTAVTTSTMASTRADNLITGAVAFISGARMDMFGVSSTLPNGEYWFAHMFTSSSSTTGTAGGIGAAGTMMTVHSRLGLLENNMGAYKQMGQSVSNSTTNVQPFHGFLATTTSNATSIINSGDVRATTGRAYINFFVSTY
jgi:hypothetical protein